MADQPIDLDAARAARTDPEEYDGLACPCGSAWWNLAVAIDRRGAVTGHGLKAVCVECGTDCPVDIRAR